MPRLDVETYKKLQDLFEQTLAALDDFSVKIAAAEKAVLLEQMLILAPKQARVFLDKLYMYLHQQQGLNDHPDYYPSQEEVFNIIYGLKSINDLIHNTPLTMRHEKTTYLLFELDGEVFVPEGGTHSAALEYDQLLEELGIVGGEESAVRPIIEDMIQDRLLRKVDDILLNHTDAVRGLLAYGFNSATNAALFASEISEVAAKVKEDATDLVLAYVQQNLDNQADELTVAMAKSVFHAKLTATPALKNWRKFKFGNLLKEELSEVNNEKIIYDIARINQLHAAAMQKPAATLKAVQQAELAEDFQKLQAFHKKLQQMPEAIENSVSQQMYIHARQEKSRGKNTSEHDLLIYNYEKAKNAADPDHAAAIAWMSAFKQKLLAEEREKLLVLKKEYLNQRHALQHVAVQVAPQQQCKQFTYYLQASGKECAGKKIINTPGGGNCFFNAAYMACKISAIALPAGIASPDDIRTAVAAKLHEKMLASESVYQTVVASLAGNETYCFVNGMIVSKADGQEVAATVAGFSVELAVAWQQALDFKNHLQRSVATYSNIFHQQDLTAESYINLMQQNGIWASDLEASVLAEVLGCCVVVNSAEQQIQYGNAAGGEIDLYHNGYYFNLLTAAETEDISKVVANDPALIAMLPAWLTQDKLAVARNKRAAESTDEIGVAIEKEIEEDGWLQELSEDYAKIKAAGQMTASEMQYWEGTFYVLNMLHDKREIDLWLNGIIEKWQQGIFEVEEIIPPGLELTVPFHVENYVQFKNRQSNLLSGQYIDAVAISNNAYADYQEALRAGDPADIELKRKVLAEARIKVDQLAQLCREHNWIDPDPTFLLNTIHSLHRDLLTAYKLAKKAADPQLAALSLFQSTDIAVCIEARVRAIQSFQNKLEGNIPFHELVAIIFAAYKNKIKQKLNLKDENLEDDSYTYIEDISEFADKYYRADLLRYYDSIEEGMQNLVENLAHIGREHRPADALSIWADEKADPAVAVKELTDKELAEQLQLLDLELAAAIGEQDVVARSSTLQAAYQQQAGAGLAGASATGTVLLPGFERVEGIRAAAAHEVEMPLEPRGAHHGGNHL